MTRRFDWTRSAVLLFKRLEAAPTDDALLAERRACMRHEPSTDIELAFEFATCARNIDVAAFLASVLKVRSLAVHAETALRTALWLTRAGSLDALRLSAIKGLYRPLIAANGAPRVEAFVHALICATESPDAFVALLAMCPPMDLTPAAVEAIVAVAWHPTIVTAISNSWIDDQYPGCWTRAQEQSGQRTAGAQQRAIETARARYAASTSGCTLEMSRTAYWTLEDRCETRARTDDEVDTFAEEPTEMHSALNTFVRTLDRVASRTFVPTKPCADVTHALCRTLGKK